jgi:hypothetical protein
MNTAPVGVPSSCRTWMCYLAAARAHRDHIARCQPQRLQVSAAQAGGGHGFERVQHGGAAGHAAGVPVLQLAAGDQYKGEVGVRALVGGNDVGGHQVDAAIGVSNVR